MSLFQHADFLLALQMNEEQYQKVSIHNIVPGVQLLHRCCFALTTSDFPGFWKGAFLKGCICTVLLLLSRQNLHSVRWLAFRKGRQKLSAARQY